MRKKICFLSHKLVPKLGYKGDYKDTTNKPQYVYNMSGIIPLHVVLDHCCFSMVLYIIYICPSLYTQVHIWPLLAVTHLARRHLTYFT